MVDETVEEVFLVVGVIVEVVVEEVDGQVVEPVADGVESVTMKSSFFLFGEIRSFFLSPEKEDAASTGSTFWTDFDDESLDAFSTDFDCFSLDFDVLSVDFDELSADFFRLDADEGEMSGEAADSFVPFFFPEGGCSQFDGKTGCCSIGARRISNRTGVKRAKSSDTCNKEFSKPLLTQSSEQMSTMVALLLGSTVNSLRIRPDASVYQSHSIVCVSGREGSS